jgi:hypothetical protein
LRVGQGRDDGDAKDKELKKNREFWSGCGSEWRGSSWSRAVPCPLEQMQGTLSLFTLPMRAAEVQGPASEIAYWRIKSRLVHDCAIEIPKTCSFLPYIVKFETGFVKIFSRKESAHFCEKIRVRCSAVLGAVQGYFFQRSSLPGQYWNTCERKSL